MVNCNFGWLNPSFLLVGLSPVFCWIHQHTPAVYILEFPNHGYLWIVIIPSNVSPPTIINTATAHLFSFSQFLYRGMSQNRGAQTVPKVIAGSIWFNDVYTPTHTVIFIGNLTHPHSFPAVSSLFCLLKSRTRHNDPKDRSVSTTGCGEILSRWLGEFHQNRHVLPWTNRGITGENWHILEVRIAHSW
jgi:hypothetical protein